MKYLLITLFTVIQILSIISCNSSESKTPVPSLDERIGEMLIVGFKGFALEDTTHIIRDVRDFHIGGVILFDYDVPDSSPNRNIQNIEQVTQLNENLQNLTNKPLFIAIDQEGGRVARLKTNRGFPAHYSAQKLGSINSADTTRIYASNMSQLLNSLGFNVNFAPVVDLNTNPQNPVIGMLERSFSEDPEIVIKHSKIFLDEFKKNNVLGVLKHFPGHGSAWNDSHVGMADVSDTWDEIELVPYRNLINSDHHFGVMTAHVFNDKWDSEDPATLSYYIQTELLRDELGFKGVLFSDDMQMDAIRAFYGLESAILKAINAGVDVLVFANNSIYDPEIAPKAVDIIKNFIEDGSISEERINQSYNRIINQKKMLTNGNN